MANCSFQYKMTFKVYIVHRGIRYPITFTQEELDGPLALCKIRDTLKLQPNTEIQVLGHVEIQSVGGQMLALISSTGDLRTYVVVYGGKELVSKRVKRKVRFLKSMACQRKNNYSQIQINLGFTEFCMLQSV